jgi:hypothetical protein
MAGMPTTGLWRWLRPASYIFPVGFVLGWAIRTIQENQPDQGDYEERMKERLREVRTAETTTDARPDVLPPDEEN